MPFIYALDWGGKKSPKSRRADRKAHMHAPHQTRAKSTSSVESAACLLLTAVFFLRKNGSYKTLTITVKYCTRMSSFTACLRGSCHCEWAVVADCRFKPLIIWWRCCEWRPEPQNCKKCCSVVFFFRVESFVNSLLLQMCFILFHHGLKVFVR